MEEKEHPSPLVRHADREDDQDGDPSASRRSLSNEARVFGMLCHLLALAFFIPLGNIIVPLVVWKLKKNESEFIDACGRDSLNFQISILIYVAIAFVLKAVLIGFVLLAAIGVFNLVCIIIASIKAYDGVRYRYPLSIRFLS